MSDRAVIDALDQDSAGRLNYAAADRAMENERRRHWVVILGLVPFRDGNKFCFLWGEGLHEGVAGFGDTVEAAMANFELNMSKPTEKDGE